MKKMDCAWEDGIPGSDFKVGTGLSWFRICLRTIASAELITDPMAAHKASESCLQIMITLNNPDNSHLLCHQQQINN